jgi:hypothetical protein
MTPDYLNMYPVCIHMGEKRGNPKRRIPENIVERVEEEQLPHEAFFHQTLARLLSDAGIDLSEEAATA